MATVADVLDRTGIDPAALVLEMTENIFIEDSERAMTVLADLEDLGIRLALDDFGTGYSSLSTSAAADPHRQDRPALHRRHRRDPGRVDDRRRGHRTSPTSSGSASSPRESRPQTSTTAIRAIGCEFAQGFFYARPMDALAIERLTRTLLPCPSGCSPQRGPKSV